MSCILENRSWTEHIGINRLLIAICFSVVLAIACHAQQESEPQRTKPNIILILTDDQGMGIYPLMESDSKDPELGQVER